jgi:putative flavoprotein involved in K+ transport
MTIENVEAVVVGGGQAGIAMSEHLSRRHVPHLVLERGRIAERWRSERWDSLVANGPAWHDRFPGLAFDDLAPDAFAPKERVAAYFADYAEKIGAPIRCGVTVTRVRRIPGRLGFRVETTGPEGETGVIEALHVIAATGPFQRPIIPPIVPETPGLTQMHSSAYRNPEQLAEGGVLVVGSGSSGTQIADELLRAGRSVTLSVGPHSRYPRRYRGRDYVWWLGVLGRWDHDAPEPGMKHVTIAVSGAHGGRTIDFRELAARGMTLVGRTEFHRDGKIHFAPDLAETLARGDAGYLSELDQADAYVARFGIDLPEEPEARTLLADPACVTDPILELDLGELDRGERDLGQLGLEKPEGAQPGITTIIWATGYGTDFSWLELDDLDAAFDAEGKPKHLRGISPEPGLYFLGLPWLSRRGSSFIYGVWHDAMYLADQIATRRGYWAYDAAVRE